MPYTPIRDLLNPLHTGQPAYGGYNSNGIDTGTLPPVTITGNTRFKSKLISPSSTFSGTPKGANGLLKTDPRVTKRALVGKRIREFGEEVGPAVQNIGKEIAPFISNIRNAFQKPPKPRIGQMNDFVTLNKVNMDVDRNEVNRAVEANTTAAYRNMPANTAAAVGMAGLGTKINANSRISEVERNANTTIGNQQTMANAAIGQGNNAIRDEYNDSLVSRDIAHKREQSANWANAGDKMMGIRNEREKAKVAMDQTRMYANAYENSQVMNALRAKAKANGEPDPLGKDYKDIEDGVKRPKIFSNGGSLPFKKIR